MTPIASYRDLFGFMWNLLRPQKWPFFFIYLLDMVAWPLETLLWPYLLHIVIDIFTNYGNNRVDAWEALKTPAIIAVCLVIYLEIISRTMGFLMAKSLPKLQSTIRLKMFDHIQHHSPHYFNERFAGALANKISDMTGQVEALSQLLFWPLVPALTVAFASIVIFWFINPLFAAILLVWMVLHLIVNFKFAKKCDLYEHRHGEARSTLAGKIVDSFTNNFAVNLFYRFKEEKKALTPFLKEEERTNISSRNYIEKMRCLMGVFYVLVGFIAMNGTLLYLWLGGQITTGQTVQIFTTMMSISGIMWNVGTVLPTLFQALGNLNQAYSVMLDPQDINDHNTAQDLKVSKGEIVFENVSFQYNEKPLFENKDVHIPGGQKVGLVGFTGSGKSTFVNLILRFFPLKKGKILIDGQDISLITLASLRKAIALIPQDPLLFHRSLKDNLLYGNVDATYDEMIAAAKRSHCHEFIGTIPQGYEAKVGERGTKLSGGEKQRIAIGRAILAAAPLLILDEATSALDSVTEKYIQESLQALMKGRTTIVIAHRLSTLSQMDRILVFDKGKIVEDGSHNALLAKGGLYATLWKMQAGGFLPEKL